MKRLLTKRAQIFALFSLFLAIINGYEAQVQAYNAPLRASLDKLFAVLCLLGFAMGLIALGRSGSESMRKNGPRHRGRVRRTAAGPAGIAAPTGRPAKQFPGMLAQWRLFRTIALVAGLCLASARLARQGLASPQSEAPPDLRERVDEIQTKLDEIRAELTRAVQDLHDPSAASTASQKMDDLEKRVQILAAALDAIKHEMRGATGVGDSAIGAPCQALMVQSQHPKSLNVALTSKRGPLALGWNSFCLDFRSTRDGSAIDLADLRVDFTRAIGRVKGMRAVAHLNRSGSGHYCGQVTLTAPGAWLVTAKYHGRFGSGKAIFLQTVE